MVKVKAQFKRRSTANNVEIYVPVPDDADTPKFRVRHQPCPSPAPRTTRVELKRRVYTGVNRQCIIRPRQVRLRLEDQAARRRARVPHARTLWAPERPRWYVHP